MQNNSSKLKIILIVILFFSFNNLTFAYDDQTTHPALTEEIVDFYNLSYPDKQLTPQQKEWIIEGSILEDIPPRWINHFYDPIYKVGWSGEYAGKFDKETVQLVSKKLIAPYGATSVSSLEWLHSEQLQAKYGFYKGVKTWEQGLLEMLKNNEEQGYKILGYILHLMEDVSVPDHTRNDTHAHELEGATGDYGSPYEEYLKKYARSSNYKKELDIANNLKRENLTPIQKSKIDDYLISLAEYSNKYFFSKDTINDSKYFEPKIIRDDGNFGYGRDEYGEEFYLAASKTEVDIINRKIVKNYYLPTNKKDLDQLLILSAYFSRLSRQAILHGAGVIDLFRNEVQLKKDYPQHIVVYDPSPFNYFEIPKISLTGEIIKVKAFVAAVVNSSQKIVSSLFNSQNQTNSQTNNLVENAFQKIDQMQDVQTQTQDTITEEFPKNPPIIALQETPEKLLPGETTPIALTIEQSPNKIPLAQISSTITISTSTEQKIIAKEEQISQIEEDQDIEQTSGSENESNQINSSQCDFDDSQSPNHRLIINEIAWMGNEKSSNNEWLEIKNPNNYEISLNGWKLFNKNGRLKINFKENDKIPSLGFYFLERTSDNSAPDIKADKIYSGAILNSNETLKFFDSQCGLIDEARANPNWPAGDNIAKKTMERKNDFNWQTSQNSGGTPKKENSQIIIYSDKGGSSGGGSNGSASVINSSSDSQNQTASSITTSTITTSPITTSPTAVASTSDIANHLVISEIQVKGNDQEDEFIELYNPTNSAISLDNYSLQYLTGTATTTEKIQTNGNKKNFPNNTQIAAKSFYLLTNINATSSLKDKANLTYASFSLSGSSNGAIIFLINSTNYISSENDANIVDYFSYGSPALNLSAATSTVPEVNQSLERKVSASSTIDSMINADKFSGNGYDTNSGNDFILTNSSNPQNSQSFPEPRNAPTLPQNFTIQYSSSTMSLNFNWSASQDYSNNTSDITYKITDISASSTFSTIGTTSTIASTTITESNFGKTYDFSLQSFDKENLNSASSTVSVNIPAATLIIAQQSDKSIFETGTGNGQFYQLLGNGLLGTPKSATFHAKFYPNWNGSNVYYISADFYESDAPDYSNAILVSRNICSRVNDAALVYYGIANNNCPNLGFEFNIDKDFTIPVQQSFSFNPAKYYKVQFITYQDGNNARFYGSNDSASYSFGKARKDNGSGTEVDAGMKDLYFLIDSQTPIEIPANISQSTPQNFELNYSTGTLALSLTWDKPRYLNASSSALTYKISDISYLVSSSTNVLSDITTSATSTTITISEVGRKYKLSITGFDANNNPTLTAQSKEISIPYSLLNQFIIAQQTDYSVFETGTGNGQFYQSLGNGLSGKLGAIVMKTNSPGYYIAVRIRQYSDSGYLNLENSPFDDIAFCTTRPQSYPGLLCSDYYLDSNTLTVPAKDNFTFDPTKYYKLYFMTYQSQSTFYGSANANSYASGQSTKDNGSGSETSTSPIQDLYFMILSATPL